VTLRHTTAAVGRRFKQGEQIGHAEELPDLLTQVDELKPAAGGFRRDVQADDSAQSHAVAMSNVGEIQHDPSPGLNELVDLGSQNVSALNHQASGATHRSDVWLYIDGKAELRRSAGGELRHNRAKINEKELRGKRVPPTIFTYEAKRATALT
jgi:hypothetical protein